MIKSQCFIKKVCLFITVFIITAVAVCAQNPQIDNAVNELARNIHIKLIEERATKVIVSHQFTFRESIPLFVSYWVNQLTGELANMPNKPYILLSDGVADADFRISGEIVETAGVIRVYTRLIRQDNRAIAASFNSDFEMNETTAVFFAGGRNGSTYIPLDSYEPDSWDNPVLFEIDPNGNITTMQRTISANNDEDFFLFRPNNDGRLVMETTGDTDTYMEFYDADTKRLLDENDDGGEENNAKIVYNVDAGKRYIAKVRGYSDENTGYYTFRANIFPRKEGASSWENPIQYELGVSQNAGVVNRALFEEDSDYFLLIPNNNGRFVMETTGSTDTYMELYDADKQLLARDDDSGEDNNAQITRNLDAGKRYIALVRGYSGETTGDYAFRAYILPPREDASSWEKPIQYALGVNQDARVVNRVLFEEESDYFLLIPNRNGTLVVETTGDTDTYMEFYDAGTKRLLAEDDDSGEGNNAQITYNIEARKRYIVLIQGYGGSGGEYGFKAYIRR